MNGIATYQIHPDGCLNGVYTNDSLPPTTLLNEIAKKVTTEIIDGDPIYGRYNCAYIDFPATIEICDLVISNRNPAQYLFEWFHNGALWFTGIGWRTNETQISVRYQVL